MNILGFNLIQFQESRFLNSEITFTDIPIIIEQACDKHDYILHPTLEELLFLENWTVDFVKSFKTKD